MEICESFLKNKKRKSSTLIGSNLIRGARFFYNFVPIDKSFLLSIVDNEHFLFVNDLVIIPQFLAALLCKNNRALQFPAYLHNSVHDTAHFSALNSIDYLESFLPMQRFPSSISLQFLTCE